jgi:hypothetical protein
MIVGTGKLSRTVLLALVWALAIAAVALIACGETVREGDVPPAQRPPRVRHCSGAG